MTWFISIRGHYIMVYEGEQNNVLQVDIPVNGDVESKEKELKSRKKH